MPRLTIKENEAWLDGAQLRSGDLLEVLIAGRRWIQGLLWLPGDHPTGPPSWQDGDGSGPSLRIPLAVANEEEGVVTDNWPDDEFDFRPYATMTICDGCVVRWLEPRRNHYSGAR
jgi:hypothetical protein